jgi:hypothetical protein
MEDFSINEYEQLIDIASDSVFKKRFSINYLSSFGARLRSLIVLLENCCRFQPPSFVNLDFCDKLWHKQNTEISWMLRQTSECNCRPSYWIWISCVHHNSLIDHTEKLIYNNFTFMSPCIIIDLFLNNQPDALIIQIYSVIKLYMFRAFSLPIIRNSLLYVRHW